MKIKYWQIICFVIVVIGATVVIFPNHRRMALVYLESGMALKAREHLLVARQRSPDDPALLRLTARVHLLNGDPRQAIDALEQVITAEPSRLETYFEIAKLYEWSRRPQQAMRTLERIVARAPAEINAWRRLIEYYHYYGELAREAKAVTHAVRLEQDAKRSAAHPDPLMARISEELLDIAASRDQTADNMQMDALGSGLYLLRQMYGTAIDKAGSKAPADPSSTIIRCLELFVRTDQLERGFRFASDLDQRQATGVARQMVFVDVLRWNGLDDKAFGVLARMSRHSPDNRVIVRRMIKIGRESDRIKMVVAELTELVRLKPERHDLQIALTEAYLDAGMPRRAFSAYQNISRSDPADSSLKERIYRAAAQAGDRPEQTYPLLKRLAIHSGGTRSALLKMLSAAEQSDQAPLMNDAIHQALALRPDDQRVIAHAARIYLALDQPAQAYPLYKRLARRAKGDDRLLEQVIQVADYTDNAGILNDAWRFVIDQRPEVPDYRLRAARFWIQRGDYENAAVALRNYVALKPRDLEAQKQLAQIFESTDQPQKAFQIYRRLVRQYPNDEVLRTHLITLAEWSGRQAEAGTLLADLSERDPRNPAKALAAGQVLVQADHLQQALPFLERALKLKPQQPDLLRNLATYYGWEGLNNKLISALEALSKQQSINRDEKQALAQAYLDRGQGGKALTLLEPEEKAPRLPPKEGVMLAMAYELLQDDARAERIYTRLYKENRADPSLLAQVGNQALGFKRIDTAGRFFEAVLKKDSQNLVALKGSAQVYAWRNDPERAIRRFEAYNRIKPDDFEVRYQLGELYFSNHRPGAAHREYRKTLKLIKRANAKRQSANFGSEVN